MPMQRHLYPKDWEKIARAVKEAAGWKCAPSPLGCGKQCRTPDVPFKKGHPTRGHKATLTVAHLDHDPWNPDARIAALCAPCHIRHDAKMKADKLRKRRDAAGQLSIL